jgi:hypothetical protein
LLRRRKRETVKGTAPIGVISFLLLAACGALCQNIPSADKASQPDRPTPPEVQRPEMRSWQLLPDAPSPVQPATQGTAAGAMSEIESETVIPPPRPSFTASDSLRFTQNEPRGPFTNHLDFQLPKPDQVYTRSTSTSFLGRVSYAASSGLLTHSASGRLRLSTSFCLGMLALAAVHTAYRPYWDRTGAAVGGDFGVSIGSNAGINVFHEFEPAIRTKARSLTPKFIYRLGERFTGNQAPRDSLPIPER